MDEMPIKKISLFKHGLGVIEREYRDTNQTTVTLHIEKNKFNEVLKSLTIIEKGKGTILYCSYPNPSSHEKQLDHQTDQEDVHKSLQSLLNNLIGKRIRVYFGEPGKSIGYASQTSAMIGTFVGYSSIASDDLLSSTSLTFFRENTNQILFLKLIQLSGIEVLDEDLIVNIKSEIKKFMDENNNLISIHLDHEQHDLIIRYTIPMAPWRISYRLLLEDDKENTNANRAMIQGLILFDNDLGEDLNHVNITFIAANPAMVNAELYLSDHISHLQQIFIPSNNILTNESYSLPNPVSVPKGASALFPVFFAYVPYKEILFFSPKLSQNLTLRSIRIINNTDFHIIEGPVSIYKGNRYLGASLLNSLPKGEDVILPFEYEDRVHVIFTQREFEEFQGVGIDDSELVTVKVKYIENEIRFNSALGYDTLIMVEQAIPEEYELAEPVNFVHRNNNLLYFDVLLPKEMEKKFQILFRKITRQKRSLSDVSNEELENILNQSAIEPAIKSTLSQFYKTKTELDLYQQKLNLMIKYLDEEANEQTRLRSNISILEEGEIEEVLKNVYFQELWESEKRYENYKNEIAAIKSNLEDLQNSIIEIITSLAFKKG